MDKPSEQNLDQTPHSGKLPANMRELPLKEDFSSSLEETQDAYLENIPSSPADLLGSGIKENANYDQLSSLSATSRLDLESTQTTTAPEQTGSRWSLGARIGAAATGAAVILATIVGLKTANDSINSTPEPNDDKGTSEIAEGPGPVPEIVTGLTVESLKIPSTLSPEEAAIKFVQNGFTDRQMQGTTQEVQDAYHASGGDITVIEKIATENGIIEDTALLTPNWKANEKLVNYSEYTTKMNITNVAVWAVTKDSGFPKDIEPFKAWTEVDSTEVLSSSETTAEVKLDVTDRNNSDKNRAGEIDPTYLKINGKKATIMVDLEIVGDSWVVADLDTSARL